jgi:hypothetical protein
LASADHKDFRFNPWLNGYNAQGVTSLSKRTSDFHKEDMLLNDLYFSQSYQVDDDGFGENLGDKAGKIADNDDREEEESSGKNRSGRLCARPFIDQPSALC